MNFFALGSYTSPQGHAPCANGDGVTIVQIEGQSLNRLANASITENPSYLAWDANKQRLHAITEAGRFPGKVDTYHLANSNSLTSVANAMPVNSAQDACHIQLSPCGTQLITASYGGGCIHSFSCDEYDLNFQNSIQYNGSSTNRLRQESSHAHQTVFSPYHPLLYVCDLGTDTIWMHRLSQNKLTPMGEGHYGALTLPPGSGPRHLVFHPNHQMVYILCELSPIIVVCTIDPDDGTLRIVQTLPCIDQDGKFNIEPAPAAIKIHPSGKTLVVSNRSRDSISLLDIHEEDGKLKLIKEFCSAGNTPRDVEFNESGSALLVANQDSNNVALFSFHSGNGLLKNERPCSNFETGTPVCVVNLASRT